METNDPYSPFNEHRRPIRITEITNNFWRPKEIALRLPEINVRQISDLAEKKVITPAIEADGAGTSRMYDAIGLYSLIVALTARNYFKHSEVKQLIKILLKEESNPEQIPLMCLINWKKAGHFIVDTFFERDGGWDHHLLTRPWGVESIKDYSRHLINLHGIKYDLRSAFNLK